MPSAEPCSPDWGAKSWWRPAPEPTPPALVSPLQALAHLPHHQLGHGDLPGWRCGRSQPGGQGLALDTAVVVVGPDGNLAGMARLQSEGQLQPRLVLDAAG